MDQKEYIKLSIIVPTIGRKSELEMLLHSIVKAGLNFTYEILIIDQNSGGFLDDIINPFKSFLPIHHHVVSFKGLSRAKNFGVSCAKGQYVSFPDDDCKVFNETYNIAFDEIEKSGADMVFGKCIDEEGNDSVSKFKKESVFLTPQNMLGGFVEATVIAEKKVLMEFNYDENMGAGTFFGSEEGFDWLYRILTESKFKAYYSPRIKFYHPQVILSKGDISSLNRVFKYRCGTAYLCVKHKFVWKFYERVILVLLASYFYFFKDSKIASYYRMEYYALKMGKIFAERQLVNR